MGGGIAGKDSNVTGGWDARSKVINKEEYDKTSKVTVYKPGDMVLTRLP